MSSLRYVLIHAFFCVVFVRVVSEWIPYNGLWYYVSEDNDTMTYAESEERCKLLQGRLAVLSGWPDDKNKLASFTGSTRRWINGEPPRVIYEIDDNEVTDTTDANETYGYICDWQCHSIGVNPNVASNRYASRDTRYDFMLGNFILNPKGASDDLRESYHKQSQTHNVHIKIYQKWRGGNNHTWCFDINNTDYVCKRSSHFTPYHDLYDYPWEYVNTSDHIQINFVCYDCLQCLEYEVSLSQAGQLNKTSGTFYRTQENAESVMYTHSDNDHIHLEYESRIKQWCLTWAQLVGDLCFTFPISPTVDYAIKYVFWQSNIAISLSCKTLTSQVQRSTVASMEHETTMKLQAYETTTEVQSTATNSHMSTEITDAFEISSITNSQTTDNVTDAHDGTTNAPISDGIRSDNKTTIYIAIAGAIGGVVLIIIISLAVVCGHRRLKNTRTHDTEHNIQNHIPKSKANIYSVDTQSTNYVEIIDSSIVVENKTGKATSEPLYEQAKDPTTENVYSEAEAVDVNNKHVYKNSFFPGSNKSQNEAGSHSSDKKTGNNTADDGNDSETEFFNNNIYEGNVNMDRQNAEVPQPVPVKSPSGSDIEMYNNSLYDASAKSIGQNRSELVKNMNNVDEDIEMYDNDLYGS